MVAAAPVSDDLHTREGQGNVGRERREQLFAGLCRQHSIIQLESRISKAAGPLPCDLSDLWRQAVLLNLPGALPSLEVPGFPAAQQPPLTA